MLLSATLARCWTWLRPELQLGRAVRDAPTRSLREGGTVSQRSNAIAIRDFLRRARMRVQAGFTNNYIDRASALRALDWLDAFERDEAPTGKIDTSDIPEQGEAFFRNAKLRKPGDKP